MLSTDIYWACILAKRTCIKPGKTRVLWGVGKREQAWSRSLGFMVKRPETRLGDNGAWAGRRLSGHQAPPKEKGFDKAAWASRKCPIVGVQAGSRNISSLRFTRNLEANIRIHSGHLSTGFWLIPTPSEAFGNYSQLSFRSKRFFWHINKKVRFWHCTLQSGARAGNHKSAWGGDIICI